MASKRSVLRKVMLGIIEAPPWLNETFPEVVNDELPAAAPPEPTQIEAIVNDELPAAAPPEPTQIEATEVIPETTKKTITIKPKTIKKSTKDPKTKKSTKAKK